MGTEMPAVPEAVLDAAAHMLNASRVRQLVQLTGGAGGARVVQLEANDGSSPRAVLKWGGNHVAASACALEFVQEVLPGLCPRLLGVDVGLGFTLQEDLGQGASLVNLLSGDDPVEAEAALAAHADALGKLAAATRGRFGAWERLIRGRGAAITLLEPSPSAPEIEKCWAELLLQLPALGIGGNIAGAETEFHRTLAMLSDRTAYAFSLGDTCPDNNRWDGTTIRLFDVDYCSYRHCLLDAAYYAAPFPTCWFVGQIPADVEERVLAAYEHWIPIDRKHLILTCWIWTILNLGWLLERCLGEDLGLGPSSLRAMLRSRLGSSSADVAALGAAPALADLLGRLGEALAARWPEAAPPPVYPAFRTLS